MYHPVMPTECVCDSVVVVWHSPTQKLALNFSGSQYWAAKMFEFSINSLTLGGDTLPETNSEQKPLKIPWDWKMKFLFSDGWGDGPLFSGGFHSLFVSRLILPKIASFHKPGSAPAWSRRILPAGEGKKLYLYRLDLQLIRRCEMKSSKKIPFEEKNGEKSSVNPNASLYFIDFFWPWGFLDLRMLLRWILVQKYSLLWTLLQNWWFVYVTYLCEKSELSHLKRHTSSQT